MIGICISSGRLEIYIDDVFVNFVTIIFSLYNLRVNAGLDYSHFYMRD